MKSTPSLSFHFICSSSSPPRPSALVIQQEHGWDTQFNVHRKTGSAYFKHNTAGLHCISFGVVSPPSNNFYIHPPSSPAAAAAAAEAEAAPRQPPENMFCSESPAASRFTVLSLTLSSLPHCRWLAGHSMPMPIGICEATWCWNYYYYYYFIKTLIF